MAKRGNSAPCKRWSPKLPENRNQEIVFYSKPLGPGNHPLKHFTTGVLSCSAQNQQSSLRSGDSLGVIGLMPRKRRMAVLFGFRYSRALCRSRIFLTLSVNAKHFAARFSIGDMLVADHESACAGLAYEKLLARAPDKDAYNEKPSLAGLWLQGK